MDLLTICFIAWLITKAIASDAPYAVRGKMPPRHLERMERLRRGEQVPLSYGLGGYLRDLFDDALRADVERRRRKATRKREAEQQGTEVPAAATAATPAAGGVAEQTPEPAAVPDPKTSPPPAQPAPPVEKPATNGSHRTTPDPDPDRGGNARVYPFPQQPQGDTMTTTANPTTDQPVAEVTGYASAVAYAKGVAAAHSSHGAGEGYVSSLHEFQVGEPDIALVQQAQEASRNAAEKWAAAADALVAHNSGVREAYQTAPEAGNKQFATSE